MKGICVELPNIRFSIRALTFLIISVTSISISSALECSLSNNYQTCTIAGAIVTRESPRFTPTTTTSSKNFLNEFILTSSTVPVLTSEVCNAFPNLLKFSAKSVSLEEIEESTFKGCPKVTEINLEFNPIKKLPEQTFAGLSQLKDLRLLNADLPDIGLELFHDLTSLEVLSFGSNKVVSLPAKALERLGNLRLIYFYSNELLDFEVEDALKSLTSLKEIHLADNNFECNRLAEILAALKLKGISIGKHVHEERKRSYSTQKVEGIHCLSLDRWNMEIFGKALYFPSFLTKFPLGQLIEAKNGTEMVHASIQTNKDAIDDLNQSLSDVVALDEIRNQSFIDFTTNIQETLEQQFVVVQNDIEQINSSMHENRKAIKDEIGVVKNQYRQKWEEVTTDFTTFKQEQMLRVQENRKFCQNFTKSQIDSLNERITKDSESLRKDCSDTIRTETDAFNEKISNFTKMTDIQIERLFQKIEKLNQKFDVMQKWQKDQIATLENSVKTVDESHKSHSTALWSIVTVFSLTTLVIFGIYLKRKWIDRAIPKTDDDDDDDDISKVFYRSGSNTEERVSFESICEDSKIDVSEI